MRVVGGRLRGRNLLAPKSQAIRPTTDRLREALFNILAHGYGDPVSDARVLDLRWLCPLPEADVLDHARATGRALIVDECRRSGNVGEALSALAFEHSASVRCRRVAAADSFIPLGDAAELVLVSEAQILEAALALMER